MRKALLMGIDQTKMDFYVQKLYAGEKKRVKAGENEKKGRINPTDAQGKEAVRKCNARCDVCGLSYRDPNEFEIHHINGNPEDNSSRNLTLVCKNCHGRIHGQVKPKIKEYEKNLANMAQNGKKPKKTIDAKCAFCDGSGRGVMGFACTVCGGKGTIKVYDPPQKCTRCGGSGIDFALGPVCPKCGGTGYENAVKK